jgi:ubiquinone/menaquinone biosynthesis C-methylase UbiE
LDKYLKQNKAHWNEITPINARSSEYDVDGFKTGKCTLLPTEVKEVGDVRGKSLLHLMCHFGMDTMSWARRGAKATGVDFSDEAIKLARRLSKETGVKADFIESDVYALPDILKDKFDIVYTSYGVIPWLPDLTRWAQMISAYLKPGGFFYIIEQHPFMTVFDNSKNVTGFSVTHSYFPAPGPIKCEDVESYAEPNTALSNSHFEWTHPLSEIVNSLIQAGLEIEFLHEFTDGFWQQFPFMKQNKKGTWRLNGDTLPLVFSLKASRPLI